jgi:hypothetical protein
MKPTKAAQGPSTFTERGYRWGKFQGWVTFILGVVVWIPTVFGSPNGLIQWVITLLVSAVMIFMGLGLIQKKRIGLILLYLNLPVIALGFVFAHLPRVETAFLVLWYILPAVFYYPKRLKEFSFQANINVPPLPQHVQQPTTNPTALPDLGKHLAALGTPQKTMLLYLTWEMETLQIVGMGHYCTTSVQTFDGHPYCATFDFDSDILLELMKAAPLDTLKFVTNKLEEDEVSTRTILLPNPIKAGIGAVLGSLQQGLQDLFIPLVIVEVISGNGSQPKAVRDWPTF